MNTVSSSCYISLLIKGFIKKYKVSSFRHKRDFKIKLKKLYIIYRQRKYQERANARRFWVRDIFTEDQRLLKGASNNLISEMREKDPEKFLNFFRMSPETFTNLLQEVGSKLLKKNIGLRDAIDPKTRLELTIRYLASGDSMASIAYLFRIGPNTVSKIVAETCQAIWDSLKDKVFLKPTENNWKDIAKEFQIKWNFKNCIGAIDGKHITMQVRSYRFIKM